MEACTAKNYKKDTRKRRQNAVSAEAALNFYYNSPVWPHYQIEVFWGEIDPFLIYYGSGSRKRP